MISLTVLLMACPQARAADQIEEYLVTAAVNSDGSIDAKVVIHSAVTGPITQVFSTQQEITNRRYYAFNLTDFKVAAAGESEPSIPLEVVADAATVTVTLNEQQPDGSRIFSYRVLGAAASAPGDVTAISWDFLQGLNLPVARFEATVNPTGVFLSVDCAAGHADSPGACTTYCGGIDQCKTPWFQHEGLAAFEVVRVMMRLPASNVAANQQIVERWTFDRAFSVEPVELLVAAGILVIGAALLFYLHWRFGRDSSSDKGIRVAEFHPIAPGQSEFRVLNNIRPGLAGTVTDERVDPVDITATLLDLAVRKHLRITELPGAGPYAPRDWTLTRTDAGPETLFAYERTLLDAIAPLESVTKVSDLPNLIPKVIAEVQSDLYSEVVTQGWFARRPDATRNIWNRLGWILVVAAVIATGVLAWLTSFGLTGLVLLVLALGMLFVSQEMPARTSKGMGVLRGLQLLAITLETQATECLLPGKEIEQFSAILPYAIVLGGPERWLNALAECDIDDEADPEDIYWYHAPVDWHLRDLPDSLRAFITTVQGTLLLR